MKKLTLAILTVGLINTAQAQDNTNRTVISDKTTAVEVLLTDETVKCSEADYSALFLKIIIPELAKLTVLDHRNTNEGGPCVAAGQCKRLPGQPDGLEPNDILGDTDRNREIMPIRVVLEKIVALGANGICNVFLEESVEAPVRGIMFRHKRTNAIATRDPEDCV